MTTYYWPHGSPATTAPQRDAVWSRPMPITPPPVPQGWQCPVCKTVWSPSVTHCRCDIPAPIPDDFLGLGKPDSVTPVRIRVTDKESAE